MKIILHKHYGLWSDSGIEAMDRAFVPVDLHAVSNEVIECYGLGFGAFGGVDETEAALADVSTARGGWGFTR